MHKMARSIYINSLSPVVGEFFSNIRVARDLNGYGYRTIARTIAMVRDVEGKEQETPIIWGVFCGWELVCCA